VNKFWISYAALAEEIMVEITNAGDASGRIPA